jgi:hypothetical protein
MKTKEIKEEKEEVKKEVKTKIIAAFATGERVEYSEATHGDNYKEIALATLKRFGGGELIEE